MRAGNRWWWWTVAGVLATAGYYLLPEGSVVALVGYSAIGLLAGLLLLAGVRWHRPARPAAWVLFSAGLILSVCGDFVWWYLQHVRHEEPYPSVADIFYLLSYPPLIGGLLLLLRQRHGRDLGGLIDAGMAAIGLGLVLWVFVLHPVATGESASMLERVVSTAYPALDVLLLAMVARLLTGDGARTPSADLLGVAAGLLLVTDIAFSVASLYFDYDGRGLDWGWLLSYVLWSAAALHPSMATPAGSVESLTVSQANRGRLAALACCVVLAPTLLFIPSIGANTVNRVVIGAGAVALFALGVTRMAGIMNKVHRQAGELQRLAMRDDLTGLGNRRHFYQILGEALPAGRPHVVLVGLSRLRDINDELGYVVGDQVITQIADRLRALAGPTAAMARLSGDEFAVLLTGVSATEADAVAARLVGVVHDPVSADGCEVLVGAGIGVADSAGDTPAEVLRRAGVAMCVSQQTGESFRRWSPIFDEQFNEQVRLGAQMRHGLDIGQFHLVYQPIVELPGQRIVAVEALVRWQHPQRGVISPALFIPVAERNGLIVELGAWILETACHQLARWSAELGPLAPDRISVNVSARQLARPGFAGSVAAVLARTGLPPHRLTVEVTETAVFGGGPAVTALHELRAQGVRIALDDFGTGHSSLALLQTVPVDIIKIDKTFVDRITEAGRHAVIAKAMMQVSNGLGLDAVAEGVETAAQAQALIRLGYRLLQGYHFGRPVAEPDFTAVRPVPAEYYVRAGH